MARPHLPVTAYAMTVEQVADAMNLSPSTIHLIERQALKKLRRLCAVLDIAEEDDLLVGAKTDNSYVGHDDFRSL